MLYFHVFFMITMSVLLVPMTLMRYGHMLPSANAKAIHSCYMQSVLAHVVSVRH
jgi:hypothetical protein